MFNESWPWKRDLASAAKRLEEARLGLPQALERLAALGIEAENAYEAETEALYDVERDVMSGAFAVRRLLGMPSKVTKITRETKATVSRFPLRPDAKAPDIGDALGDLAMYDMRTPEVAVITANELCNLFIHSMVFRFAWTLEGLAFVDWLALDERDPRIDMTATELAGWLVATDKSSARYLTLASLEEVVRVMRIFADDEVSLVMGRRDPKGRMHFTAK